MAPARFPPVLALGVWPASCNRRPAYRAAGPGCPGCSLAGEGVEPRGHEATSGRPGGPHGRPRRRRCPDPAPLRAGLLPPRSLGPGMSGPSERGHGPRGSHLMEKLLAPPQAAVAPSSGASVFSRTLCGSQSPSRRKETPRFVFRSDSPMRVEQNSSLALSR